jgi:hypothetical protein
MSDRPRIWTPPQGGAGLILIARPQPLSLVIGGRIVERSGTGALELPPTVHPGAGRQLQRTPGGLIIVSSARRREPTRIVGHPDLASGASVQRGETLYVSIAEAVYKESRGDTVELHFTPTEEDNEALKDLRVRARNRWENDRLPDGWTRPLPPPTPKSDAVDGIPDALQDVYEEMLAKQRPDA